MDYENLKTNISSLDYIKELKITQNYNNHAKIYLTGLLKDNSKDKYNEIMNSTKNIEVFMQGDTKNILFTGIVQESTLKHQGEVYYIELKGISYSYLLDLKKKSCSYQDISATYRNIFESIVKNYNGKIIDNISGGKTIDNLLIQYEETDWEFMVRMVSHFNSGILPDITFASPYMVFGMREGYNSGVIESYEYCIKKDISQFRKLAEHEEIEIMEADMIEYNIQSYKDYPVGSQVKYLDNNFYIKSKDIQLEQGLLIFTYSVSTKKGISTEKMWNEAIVGLILKAKVTEVSKDKIKAMLEIDQGQEKETRWDFTYSTMYAPKGRGGWYCMPEIGDTVLIHFPTKEESEAFAMNSLRNANDENSDTSIKYLRTADGKELRFTTDGIIISCSNYVNEKTGEKNIIYIDLKDSNGITITSTKPVNIHSDSNLNLNSKKKITISADDEITLKCKTSQIMLNEMVDISGKIVRIN